MSEALDDTKALCPIPRQSPAAAAWQSRFASLGPARTTKEGLRELSALLARARRVPAPGTDAPASVLAPSTPAVHHQAPEPAGGGIRKEGL